MTPASAAGAYLYDDGGQRCLDAGISNTLVGYGHPRVAEAVAAQMASADMADELRASYVHRFLQKFSAQFSICYLLNSLSEANELALRLARAHRPGKDVIVLDDASYGMTTSLANMSPAQCESRGIGKKFWVHAASRGDASHVAAKAREIDGSGRGLCGFFAEGIFQDGYLCEAYAAVRAAGGLNVAIEAQTGMGRVGQACWEFARQGAMPDVVVVGESMANGLPLAAVVTRQELAAPFELSESNAPAMVAAATAVLDCSGIPMPELDWPMAVRGAGLCFEIDVRDGAAAVARLREKRVLIARRGNTLLFRPPLTFSAEDASYFVDVLSRIY